MRGADRLASIFALALILVSCQSSAAPPPPVKSAVGKLPSVPEVLPENRFVVGGKALRVDDDPRNVEENAAWAIATFEVTHVYCGPADLLGRRFVGYGRKDGVDWHGVDIQPLPKPGEEGVWLILRDEDGGQLETWINTAYDLRFPGRRGVDHDVEAKVALAKAIEQVCDLPPDQRWAKLEKDAADREDLIGRWSVGLLVKTSPADARRPLRELIRRGASVGAMLAADQVLATDLDAHWANSAERKQFLLKLTSGLMTEDQADRLYVYLMVGVQRGGGMSEEEYAFAFTHALANKEIKTTSSMPATDMLTQLDRYIKNEQVRFDIRLKAARAGSSIPIRAAAAESLMHMDLSKDGRQNKVNDVAKSLGVSLEEPN